MCPGNYHQMMQKGSYRFPAEHCLQRRKFRYFSWLDFWVTCACVLSVYIVVLGFRFLVFALIILEVCKLLLVSVTDPGSRVRYVEKNNTSNSNSPLTSIQTNVSMEINGHPKRNGGFAGSKIRLDLEKGVVNIVVDFYTYLSLNQSVFRRIQWTQFQVEWGWLQTDPTLGQLQQSRQSNLA